LLTLIPGRNKVLCTCAPKMSKQSMSYTFLWKQRSLEVFAKFQTPPHSNISFQHFQLSIQEYHYHTTYSTTSTRLLVLLLLLLLLWKPYITYVLFACMLALCTVYYALLLLLSQDFFKSLKRSSPEPIRLVCLFGATISALQISLV